MTDQPIEATVLMKCVTLCLTGRSILQGWTKSG